MHLTLSCSLHLFSDCMSLLAGHSTIVMYDPNAPFLMLVSSHCRIGINSATSWTVPWTPACRWGRKRALALPLKGSTSLISCEINASSPYLNYGHLVLTSLESWRTKDWWWRSRFRVCSFGSWQSWSWRCYLWLHARSHRRRRPFFLRYVEMPLTLSKICYK